MRKHGRIKNLDNFLRKYIEPIESVNLITPGAIKVGKGTGEVLKVRWGKKTLELVNDFYKEDFKKYGYEKL